MPFKFSFHSIGGQLLRNHVIENIYGSLSLFWGVKLNKSKAFKLVGYFVSGHHDVLDLAGSGKDLG
jgi:hypothetical protein